MATTGANREPMSVQIQLDGGIQTRGWAAGRAAADRDDLVQCERDRCLQCRGCCSPDPAEQLRGQLRPFRVDVGPGQIGTAQATGITGQDQWSEHAATVSHPNR